MNAENCECVRCKPSLNQSWDWCFKISSHIDENGRPIE